MAIFVKVMKRAIDGTILLGDESLFTVDNFDDAVEKYLQEHDSLLAIEGLCVLDVGGNGSKKYGPDQLQPLIDKYK